MLTPENQQALLLGQSPPPIPQPLLGRQEEEEKKQSNNDKKEEDNEEEITLPMGKDNTVQSSDMCPRHTGKKLQLFCRTHWCLCCSECTGPQRAALRVPHRSVRHNEHLKLQKGLLQEAQQA